MESLTKTRVRELGGFNSAITLKSRFVPQWTKVSFRRGPTTLHDPPAPLNLGHKGSVELHVYRMWLSEQLPYLQSLSPIGNKQIDNHHTSLIRRCKQEIARVNELELRAWHEEMANTGLLFQSVTRILEPSKAPIGKLE